MNGPNVVLKIAVVASSVLLVVGFVAYRAGAFNGLLKTEAAVAGPEDGPTLEPDPFTIMSGSKDYILVQPDLSTIMSSPKSMPLVEPAPTQQPAPAAPPVPTVMGGSKFTVLIDPPAAAPPVPTVMSGSKSLFRQVTSPTATAPPAGPK